VDGRSKVVKQAKSHSTRKPWSLRKARRARQHGASRQITGNH
jgi:hypothetical protein